MNKIVLVLISILLFSGFSSKASADDSIFSIPADDSSVQTSVPSSDAALTSDTNPAQSQPTEDLTAPTAT
ncbi:MAG: hypothetical protein NTZ84_00450, partial [Candidatus Nealsonbacteria bacterium]|nr:hypothetical protein [Candidatus Nealsonbacteria bacterium]